MVETKPHPGRPAKDPGRKAVFARIPAKVYEALDNLVEEYSMSAPRADKGAHIEFALIEYLSKRGHWPPK